MKKKRNKKPSNPFRDKMFSERFYEVWNHVRELMQVDKEEALHGDWGHMTRLALQVMRLSEMCTQVERHRSRLVVENPDISRLRVAMALQRLRYLKERITTEQEMTDEA